MSKQDRQGARTTSDLEYKYQFGKSFAEIMGIATDARDRASAAEEAFQGLDQQEIFKRLTNNGNWQGLYEANGEVYINASYIKSGQFLADLITAGVLQSVDGETFKLDLDRGTMVLKSGSREIMNISKEGAKLSGWTLSPDYLGTANAGLNGNVALQGISEHLGMMDTIRFYAGANNSYKRKTVIIDGHVNNNGIFTGSEISTFLLSEILVPQIVSIQSFNPLRNLSESDFDKNEPLTITRVNPLLVSARGKLTDETLRGKDITLQFTVNSYDPQFQVWDNGNMIANYAEINGLVAKEANIGGHTIASLVERIEALEAK